MTYAAVLGADRTRVQVQAEHAPTPVRIEIQALRALAVVLVVAYHLWPHSLTGGYTGVDVFLVISGFLITSHLLGEISRTGRISLPRFWARRARRLLPASLFVLAAVTVVTVTLVPDTYWHQYMSETGASAMYVQNWRLAADAVDYLAAENSASPVQHFWSLSVEEQFYLMWPVLLLGAAWCSRGLSRRGRRTVLFGVMATVTAGSLIVSAMWTHHRQASAYFVTPTRMWEFSLGGLLAFLPTVITAAVPRLRAVLSVLGLAAICVSAISFTNSMAFPGLVALVPTLGAAAVIAAGNPASRASPTRLMGIRPVQFLGNVSYSLYLWHWPLIVLVPIISHTRLTTGSRLLIVGASIVLAWLSKVFIEDRFRTRAPSAGARPRWVFVLAILSTLTIVGATTVSISVLNARNARAAERVLAATSGSCFGAAALEVANHCPDPFASSGAMTPAFAKTDMLVGADPAGGWKCETSPYEVEIRNCAFGNTTDPERTIAMLGDSHAMHYLAALTAIADSRNWEVTTYFKSACSGTGDPHVVLKGRDEDQGACAQWGDDALAAIIANPDVDSVVFANVRSAYSEADGAQPIGPDTYDAAWKRLTDAGKKVLVIEDVPRTFGGDVPDCLSTSADPSGCDVAAGTALPDDAAADAAAAGSNKSVRLLDLTDKFCTDGLCHARIGGVVVYADAAHLTNTYARTLAPYIEVALINL